MLADFQIPTLQNDMKLVVWKNHLGGQILYRRGPNCKKQRQRKITIKNRKKIRDFLRSYP